MRNSLHCYQSNVAYTFARYFLVYRRNTGALKSRERTSRDLTTRHQIARVDIVRLDNAKPYRKGGHRESGET